MPDHPKAKAEAGFLGGGMMASALIAGLESAGAIRNKSYVSEPYAPAREKLAKAGYRVTTSNVEVVRHSDVVFVAVKPDVVPTVLREVGPALGSKKLLVSIAAGVDLETLEAALPTGARVLRVMPNICCLVSQSASAIARGANATDADVALVHRMLGTVGHAEEVPEKLMDAVTGLSGSGPAFGFMMVEALADGGVQEGLPRPTALALAAQTLKGAADMVLTAKMHPAVLKDQVCSPGGTTIAGVGALERLGLRAAAMGAVSASAKRSAELRVSAQRRGQLGRL